MTLFSYIIDWLRRLSISLSPALGPVATYTRELPVSMERMYENAIDGEHLPWLHKDSFSSLTILEQGKWGWRAEGHLQPKSFMTWMELELRLEPDKHRWITTTRSGLGKGTQIVTHAIPLGDNSIKVVVDFYVPKLPRFLHGVYAKQFVGTYAKLYDEDLWMMATRQQELDRIKSGKPESTARAVELGILGEVEKNLPLNFELLNRPYRAIRVGDQLLAHATTCPHMLGPLQDADIENGEVVCPWHGYSFNVETRECTSGQKCKLAPAPVITVNPLSGQVVASI
jgi:nitrite reductase/ring-hydroxylating ferredoxin subunit